VDGNGQTYTVNFGQTVYGGNLDLTTGVLTVTNGIYTFTGNETIVSLTSARFRIDIYNYINDIDNNIGPTDLPDALMEVFQLVPKNTLQNYDNAFGLSNDGNPVVSLFLRLNSSSTASDVVAAITGTKLVYPLATPVTYQLTPVQVQALLGVNNVFNDTNGDTEVKYKEGIQHYIDKKIAATQALIL
jgi:hypothetical protein